MTNVDWVSVLEPAAESLRESGNAVLSLLGLIWCQTMRATHFVLKIKIPFPRKW